MRIEDESLRGNDEILRGKTRNHARDGEGLYMCSVQYRAGKLEACAVGYSPWGNGPENALLFTLYPDTLPM